MYEYKVVDCSRHWKFSINTETFQVELNKASEEGWELVSTFGGGTAGKLYSIFRKKK